MPPVFGPRSPSARRLKSWADAIGETAAPSQRHSRETSGPLIPSSITTRRPASPKARPESLARTSSSASDRDSVTSTPLPAASPSVLTT